MTAHVLGALKVLHVRSINEIPRLLDIPTANGAAPIRAHIMAVRLQDVLFTLKIRVVDSSANVAHGNSEGALPARTLSPWVRPLVLEG